MAVLLLAEIAGGALALDATAKAVTAAKSLGDVTVLVAGPAAAGEAAAKNRAMRSRRCWFCRSIRSVRVPGVVYWSGRWPV